MRSRLRVCAGCEWIFKIKDGQRIRCPKCDFVTYSAWYTYGRDAYRFAKTQKPWKDKKMAEYAGKLEKEIRESSK